MNIDQQNNEQNKGIKQRHRKIRKVLIEFISSIIIFFISFTPYFVENGNGFVLRICSLILIVLAFKTAITKPHNNKKKYQLQTYTQNKQELFPFKKKNYFFTKRELNFYKTLKPIADKYNLVIFSKARIADIVEVKKIEKRQSYLNKIVSKHIDFILCDNVVFSPKVLIELDDITHDKPNRIQRDEFVNKIMDNLEIPLLRFREYNTNQIESEIQKALNKNINTLENIENKTNSPTRR